MTTTTMHRKTLSLRDAEVKFRAPDSLTFTGRAASFNAVDFYGDTILPGAFSNTLKDRPFPVLMLKGHNPSLPIGIWKSLTEKKDGLYVEGELTPGNSIATDTAASLKHGAVGGLSVGFFIPDGGSDDLTNGGRVIREVDLMEISVVSFPADAGASVTNIKAAIDALASLADAEALLREVAGFGGNEATALVAMIRKMGGYAKSGDPAAQSRNDDRRQSGDPAGSVSNTVTKSGDPAAAAVLRQVARAHALREHVRAFAMHLTP